MNQQPSLYRLARIFFRAGNTTFGGGDPTMAVLYSELVTVRGWLSSETYGLIYALARVTPGTNLLAFCAGAAWTVQGWLGALVTVAVVTLPAAALILIVTEGYQSWRDNRFAMAAINGTLAAAVGMMLSGAWHIVRPRLGLRALVICGAAIGLSLGLRVSPIPILAMAALTGLIWRR